MISRPRPVAPCYRGDTVTLVVSDGPELVEVPGGLVASGVDAATETLQALGFVVETETPTATSAWATSSRSTRRPGRWRPGAPRSRCT